MIESSHLLLWPILVLGLFNSFWVPLANYFGKRPVFVLASLLLCTCYIWGACASSFDSLLWSNIIAAFAGSSTEALGAAMVNDLYFVHERGQKMGIYMNAIADGNTVGPLVCGFIVTNLSWRWHKWIAAILTALTSLSVLLFVPETRYNRDLATTGGSTNILDPADDDKAIDEKLAMSDMALDGRLSNKISKQVPKKTYFQGLSLWSGTPSSNISVIFARPFLIVVYSAVIYSALCYSISLALVFAVNILNPFVLQSPSYSWSPQINGLINIPGLFGNMFGSWIGGERPRRLTTVPGASKATGAFLNPRPDFIYSLSHCSSLQLGALYLVTESKFPSHGWQSMFFGFGMISVALTAIPTITMAYVTDCLLPVNSDALLLVNGVKNIVAFGFLYGIVPRVDRVGYVSFFGIQAGVFVGVIGVDAIALVWLGARARHATAQWRVILV